MFCTVLPSAATMPMASTNSGKAMIVSAMRPTTRSVQPPKNPAATPASPPMIKTGQGREHDREKQREGKTGHRVLAENVTGVPQPGGEASVVCEGWRDASSGGNAARRCHRRGGFPSPLWGGVRGGARIWL